MRKEILREIYFNEDHEAVIVMESPNKANALAILRRLPLVRGGYISFEAMELKPYTGFARLVKK
jgi:hypothetical protein